MVTIVLNAVVIRSTLRSTHPSPTAVPVGIPLPGSQTPGTASVQGGTELVVVWLLVLLTVLFASMLVARLRPAFLRVPYSSWYALHNDVAIAALILVTILGVTSIITGEVISGLFAAVIGYVLGSAGSRSQGHVGNQVPLVVATASPLPKATTDQSYATVLKASGGVPPYTWTIAAGGLPAGLTLDKVSGTVHGIPTGAPSDTTVAITVTDSANVVSPPHLLEISVE